MQIQTLGVEAHRGEINTIKDFFSLSDALKSQDTITWCTESGDVLAVDWHDLGHRTYIPWKDINIVVTETFQQIVDALKLFDYNRSYIIVTESFATPNTIKTVLPNLKIIKNFTRFVEIFEYGQRMCNPVHQYTWTQGLERTPLYDFFCLLGRTSWLRSHMITRLSSFDIGNSLVKYNGKPSAKSLAPNLDPIAYDPNIFYSTDNTFSTTPWLIPAKLIPTELYQKFYFEIQHETDPYLQRGWQIAEFHLTEKTIKPLIMGVPCLMLGAPGYNNWLLESFGIDLSLGQFDMSFDPITNNMQRVDFMLAQVPELIKNKVSLNTHEQHAKNMLGFYKLRDFNLQQFRDLYNLMQSL